VNEYYFYTDQMVVGYDGIPLIREIEIKLKQGEILTLIGPNGAGKSTILKSIVGQLKLVSGAAYLDGNVLGQMRSDELAKKMAVVFTERLRTEMMSCEDVVATGRYPYTGKFGILSEEDYAIVEEAMELVHVTELRNQDFTKISDGQRQRVMLARAICQQSEIIILDEPTSYLDVKYKLEFLSVLQELKRKKQLSVIMSLHELDLAERVSDKILCVKGDHVEKFGTPEEIFTPGYINDLFRIKAGNFDEASSDVELEAPKGDAKIFVIAGNGSGRNVYRRLQREGKAFVTGILYENDLDYPVAKALATQTLSARAFEPVSDEVLAEAKAQMDACEQVICCRDHIGPLDAANEELLKYAKLTQKITII
jgi:iron complex transport system ATP-binding protein